MKTSNLLSLLGMAAVQSPRKVIALVLLALIAVAMTFSYVGYLVITMLSLQFDTSRFLAGLMLGVLFARFPRVREGKLGTIGLLPKPARQPVMAAILVFCLLRYLQGGQAGEAAAIGVGLLLILGFAALRKKLAGRFNAFKADVFTQPQGNGAARGARVDHDVIDVEFREKKE
ncbi:hypothetical protein [Noviherbaspirillum galbum]|uniref:Uncharacterized protein n=1 Tax=Noviherbaspirillum galbum TaxID=2709383 RepID=A0A6B3SM60_9BURK|nr:hypothetical protein [Noviherbaspirillum galbum]NEX61911.1 hypothetical protein [Noviherbaspirillum galbum]